MVNIMATIMKGLVIVKLGELLETPKDIITEV